MGAAWLYGEHLSETQGVFKRVHDVYYLDLLFCCREVYIDHGELLRCFIVLVFGLIMGTPGGGIVMRSTRVVALSF